MSQQAPEHNPFMLLMHPEVVLAAIEKSERLGQLNRHLCRPLDRQSATPDKNGAVSIDATDPADAAEDEPELESDD